jgi:general stress protein 26
MEYEKELKRLEDIEYLRGKIDHIRTAMLTTYSLTDSFRSRPMGTAQLDAQGNLWFFTNELSTKVAEISHENKVHITYADSKDNVYLSLDGIAETVDDKVKMQELWNPFVKVYFPKGLDDPKLTLLKVHLTGAEYWDSSEGKLVVLFKIALAKITGGKPDLGKHDAVKL